MEERLIHTYSSRKKWKKKTKKKHPKHTDKEKAKGIASRLDGERKAEQNTRERGERRKHIIPRTGRGGEEQKRKVGERERSTKKWRGEEEKETVISPSHPVCQPLYWAL